MMSPDAARAIKLRDYQTRSIEEVRAAIRAGHKRIVLTIPTGGGKTYTSAFIIVSALSKGKRCMFVAHRLELIDQTCRAFTNLGVTTFGVIRAGDKRRDRSQPLQIASIQTLARREQDDFDIIVIDEGHRAVSASYKKHLFERHPNAIFIILTATPIRADGKPLRQIADHLVIGATYSQLIAQGSIAAPDVYGTPLLPDLSQVRTEKGDFNTADLEKAMAKGALIGDLFEQWNKRPRQRTVCFAVSVAHSRMIVETFREKGVRAEHLDGNTDEDERKAILARLASGETELVSNVAVLTEGWDLPACKTVILARPTKSLSLFMQTAGRCLRPWNDVTPLILDHGGNVDRFGLPHMDRDWSLDACKVKKGDGAPPVKTCPECFAYVLVALRHCPHCGYEFPSAVPDPKAKDPVPLDLELRTLAATVPIGQEEKLGFFRHQRAKARANGYKSRWVEHRYFDEFGEHPPAEWVEALRRDFKGDVEWKSRIKAERPAIEARREQRRLVEEAIAAPIEDYPAHEPAFEGAPA